MKKLTLLGDITPEQFLRDYWHKKPLLIRQAIPGFKPLLPFDKLAELATKTTAVRVLVDRFIEDLNAGKLSVEDAAMAKWWSTEEQLYLIDRCLQLHGGYGYMKEYPIAKAYMDARVQTIYGGTTEIMKEIIGRSLKLS